MKHTLGPLTITKGEDGFYSIWYDSHKTGAEIASNIGEEAYARLFAAAHDLREACKRAAKYLAGAPCEDRQAVEVLGDCSAAIAKAEPTK